MRRRKGPPPVSLASRFWNKVDKRDPAGCWIWLGQTMPNGYGRTSRSRAENGPHSVYAHRAAWELTHGVVPTDLLVCHTCDNRVCVNPAHLFVGTQKDNIADMDAKCRRVNSPAPKGTVLNAKITQGIANRIRKMHVDLPKRGTLIAPGEMQGLAARFGISVSQVYNVVTGKCWAHGA